MSRYQGPWVVAVAKDPFPDHCGVCGEPMIVDPGVLAVTPDGVPLCGTCVDRSEYDLLDYFRGRL